MSPTALGSLKWVATEPFVTGSLLYLLTHGPVHVRERMLQPFQHNLLSSNGPARIAALATVLKVLTAAGVLGYINRALNRLALNGWSFRRQGAPWRFGREREELVVITGGSSGIGYEMVKGFAVHARVVAVDVSPFPPELEKLDGVSFYRCDITDTPAVRTLCEQIRSTHGDPSVLINNAGIGGPGPILSSTHEHDEKLLKVNLLSHFVLIREFLPGMLKKRKGHVVAIASMASFVAGPNMVDYCVSKVGALYLNDGLRAECLSRYEGGEGICTTSVHPHFHATPILQGQQKALERRGYKVDPPTNVSKVVVEQVLKARSGRLIVPAHHEWKTSVRSWPLWVQDLALGLVLRKKRRMSES